MEVSLLNLVRNLGQAMSQMTFGILLKTSSQLNASAIICSALVFCL